VDEAAMESLFPQNAAAAGNSDQAAPTRGPWKQQSRLLDPKRLQNVAIMLKALNVTADEVIAALVHGEFAYLTYFPYGPLQVLSWRHKPIVCSVLFLCNSGGHMPWQRMCTI
jgi:hypothetical protein